MSDYHDVSIEPWPGANFRIAQFRLWHPADFGEPAGILAVFSGFNSDGRKLSQDPYWQAAARRHNLALLAYHMVAIWPAGIIREHLEDHYTHVIRGSGTAFWNAVRTFATMIGHPGLAERPCTLWGHSAGGQFAYSLACHYPRRIIGFVSVKGGFYHSQASDATRRCVPGLIIAGANDEQFRRDAIRAVFTSNRRRGALWCTAIEPGAGHGVDRSNDMAVPYLDAVIKTRAGIGHDGTMATFNETDGWLGDLESGRIYPHDRCPINPLEAAWLPNRATAEVWATFVTRKPHLQS